MDLDTLRAALKAFEDRPQAQFALSAQRVAAWPDVQALVQSACAASTLTITAIASFPPDRVAGAVVYSGHATLFPWSPPASAEPRPVQATLAVTARFTIDAAGAPQLTIDARPATPWHLSDSIGGLWGTVFEAVSFDAARFYLTSAPATDSRYPGPLPAGVSFLGAISPAGAFGRTGGLLVTEASRTVTGQIGIAQTGQPTISLVPTATDSLALAGLRLSLGAQLSSWTRAFDDPGAGTWSVATAEVVAGLQAGGTEALELRMPMLSTGGALSMSLREGGKSIEGWTAIGRLAGGADLSKQIPSEIPTAGKVVLEGLDLFLDLGDGRGPPRRAAAALDIALHTGAWAVLPKGIMSLEKLGARLSVDFLAADPAPSGLLYGTFELAGIRLTAAISLPQLDLTVGLDDDVPVPLADVMDQFMRKVTGLEFRPPLPEMSLARLDLGASLRDGTFELQGDIPTGWSVALGSFSGQPLATLSFDGIGFSLDYDGQALAAAITATTSIDTAHFYMSASTPGGADAGWTLGAGLVPGASISVSGLLQALMFGTRTVPGTAYGVPQLVIDALDMSVSLDSQSTPYAFEVGGSAGLAWKFKVFDTSPELKLAVGVLVSGRKPPPERGLVAADAAWSISGNVDGTLVLYGFTLSAGYQFAEGNSALTFGIWYGNRGLEATVTQRPREKTPTEKETILTVRLGDLSLGEILEYLVQLAAPGESRRLPSPWDVLYQVDFKNLSLVANLTTKEFEVKYDLRLNLGFAKFDAIGLLYKQVNGEGRVYLRLYGDFLGQTYGKDGKEPLGWDVVNEAAPDVSGKGPEFLDIRYVGVGQHLALSTPDDRLTTVESVITALKASMKPVAGEGNPLTDPAAATLRYDGAGKWLFGVQAKLVETVDLAAVFYDPHLYGALIELSGERAGSLAGLRFELLYRPITADIGEYSVDLTIPERFRNWEFGEVSVTLGHVHLDVYTNGNFRIDAGFPHGGDFSSSFTVEVFPFVGRGGFYFAYLTGATSKRVPRADNGVFDPVIEAGVGISVGLGKDFHKGPLSAGLTLEVYGIFEGVFAPFSPYDRALPRESYYWFQGTAGVVGKLYGAVDFVVLKVSVSVTLRASATIVIEAHEATQVDLRLEVEAEGTIQIAFITLHFKFSLTVEAGFTIGSHTAAPWIHAPAPSPLDEPLVRTHVLGPPEEVELQPLLRRQLHQQRPRSLARLRHARERMPALRSDPGLRAGRARAALLADDPMPVAGGWKASEVYGGAKKTARVQFAPGFSVADPATLYASDPAARHPDDPVTPNQVQAVLALVAENTIAVDARSAEEVAEIATDHLHFVDENGLACLPRLTDAFLRWAAKAGAGVSGAETITAVQLQDLLDDLADPDFQQATFAYSNVADFFAANLKLEVAGYPATTRPGDTSGTFFPIVPEITAAISGEQDPRVVDFGAGPLVSDVYSRNLAAYFEQLATDAAAAAAADPLNRPAAGPETVRADGDDAVTAQSLAQVVFGDYFALLTRAALQGAIDLLSAYPLAYPESGGKSLAGLAAEFDGITVPTVLGRGQTLDHLAAATGVHPDDLAAANPRPVAAGDQVDVPVAVTAASIAEDNADAPLAAGRQFNVTGLPYQVRSGQTLTGVAAAAPSQVATGANGTGILPPPTGAAVGVRNAKVGGLLSEGATVTIPSYAYTRLAGDSDAFLTAFFAVRNKGVDDVDRLDWYSQAIATLNPAIDWSTIAPGETITVPSAYLSSMGAAAQYPIHQGDTLPRIAATFATFERGGAQYTPSPAGGSYTVPQVAHTVTATDTFANLAGDTANPRAAFPGLPLADLVAANVNAAVLAPLATLTLPDYGAQVGSHQTLATLAQAFDLDMAGLVALVGGVAEIFTKTALTIRDVPARSLDVLIADLLASRQANEVAAQLSRFLMHGMRMPAPDDAAFLALSRDDVLAGKFSGPLYGLYDLTGQQIEWPDTTQPVGVALTKSQADWLVFVATETRDGAVVAVDTTEELDLVIDDTRFAQDLPDPTLTLWVRSLEPMPLFGTSSVRHNLQANVHWQAAARPTLPAGAGAAAAGEPTIWPFSADLARVAAGAGTGTTPAYGLCSVPIEAPAGTAGTALQSYAWAVRVPFAIERVGAARVPGADAPAADGAPVLGPKWLERVYLVGGADQSGANVLYDLMVRLGANATAEAATRLFLAYRPNATEANPGGLASDAIDGSATYLLKTNLSTDTRQPAEALLALAERGDDPAAPVYSASIAPPDAAPTGFVTFLWQASVVSPGGFYLHYQAGTAGLPDSIFDDTGQATIELVCLLGSQTGGSSAGGRLYSFNNAAVVGDNVDASAVQVYATQTGTDAPTVKIPSLPPGNVGFTMIRTPPEDSDLTGRLYNLFGFQLAAEAPFAGSNEGLPAGPIPAPAPDTGNWLYRQVLDVARRTLDSNRIQQHSPALPDPLGDPYAAISATATASLSFAAHDAFGNRATATDAPGELELPVRYADRVIGLSEWPGATGSYAVAASGGQPPVPELTLALALQHASYVPGPGLGTAPALYAASAAALRYRQVFYQLSRPGIAVTATTTLDHASEASPLVLSRARLAAFVAAAYAFTDQVAGLTPVEHTVVSGDALGAVAGSYSVTAADLLEANQELLAAKVLSGTIAVPRFARVAKGATLGDLAVAGGISVTELIGLGANEDATVPAGIALTIADVTLHPAAGQTLADMASAAGCKPGDIGAANATTAGLIADGLTITVGGIQLVTSSSTFASLAAEYAERGLGTSPAEVAALNADVPGIFAVSGPSGPTSYVVRSWTVPAGMTLAKVITDRFGGSASDFAGYNGSTPGVVAEGTRLRTGTGTETVPSGVTLRDHVVRVLGLSMGELAAANPGATLTAGTSLAVPALLDPGPLTAVPYAVGSQQSLDEVAKLFGTDATTLGEDNRDLGGLFVPGQPVEPAGFGSVTTGGEDSIADLLAKFPAPDRPTLDQLIGAIASSTTLLRTGAVLICPPPEVPSGTTTLAALAARFGFGSDVRSFARANASLDGLLDPAATVTVAGRSETVGVHGTLTSLYARLVRDGAPLTFDDAIDAIAGAAILATGAKHLLPPPGTAASVALPSAPAVTCTITPLAVDLTIARPTAEVDSTLADTPAIAAATSAVPPLSAPPAPGEPASYATFAADLEAAYGDRLRVATGAPLDADASPSSQRLYTVRFEPPGTASVNAIEKVQLGTSASYFALPPLCNELVSRTAAIRTYKSGAEDPLPSETTTRTYQAVDVQSWADDAIAAIDLVLSPAYAAAAFAVTRAGDRSSSFDALVAAKSSLATKIANGLTGVLDLTGGDATAAAKALEQRLDVSLVDGFATDAVVQLPAAIAATFDASKPAPSACADRGGHRLAGKTQSATVPLGTTTTLAGLASTYGVHVDSVARLLGTTPNLLHTGTTLTVGEKTWTIEAQDTLADGVTTLGLVSLDAFAATFGTQAPLFRDGASVTIDGYSTTTVAADTLAAAADRLDSAVRALAVANQSLEGLLAVPGTIYVDGVAHTVTEGTSSLATMAASLSLDVESLAEEIAGQAALAGSKTLKVLRWIPSHSLSPGKIDLGQASGRLNLLLGVEQRAQYRRLLLNLDFELTGLEYGIEAAPAMPGYERSDWLRFVTPLDDAHPTAATIATDVGQLDVPIPLRAYPTPPRLVGQFADPTYTDAEVSLGTTLADRLSRAKAWTYRAVFETAAAAQDVVYLDVGFNFAPDAGPVATLEDDDPFQALAEFNANYPAIREDLTKLLLPDDQRSGDELKAAKSATAALATIAANIALHWGPVRAARAADAAGDGLVPARSYGFRLEARTRSGPRGTNVMDSLVLVSTDPQPSWGPDGKPPALGYLDGAGNLVELRLVADPLPGAREVVYEFGDDVPAFADRSYSIWYPGLDPVVSQNARTSVWLTRNASLIPGKTTAEPFVYRTPEVHFHDPISPSIVRSHVLGIGAGPASGLGIAAAAMFADLLGTPPTAATTSEKLAVRYGYRAVAAGGEGAITDDDIVVFTPVVFRPLFRYADSVPTDIQSAVDTWLGAAAPPTGQTALFSLDLVLFSELVAGTRRPLVELKRLDYTLA